MRRTRTKAAGVLGVIALVVSGFVSTGTALAAETGEPEKPLTGDITFSVPSGTFQGQVSVTMSTSIANAQIRYTTDSKAPTSSSPVAQGAVAITKSTQLRAQAFVNGAASGAMGTAVYIARSMDATHDLPLVVLDAYGAGKPNKTDYKQAAALVIEPKNNVATLATPPAVASRAGFRVRGQSSSNFEKTPYRLELWNNDDTDADLPLLGMPADGDWALLGPFPDKSLIRNAFAYAIGKEMGLKVPNYRFVEVYLNLDAQPMAANDYQGVYLLIETMNSAKRLGLQKLAATDLTEPAITGSYIMQFNWMATEPPTLTCKKVGSNPCWSDLELVYPNDPPAQQLNYITDYVQKFHDSLRSANPSDAQTGYPAYIDVDSFINRMIVNEMSREGDAYTRSTHFYKDRGGKLTAGPLWDYDLGFESFTGMGGFGGTSSTVTGWQYSQSAGFGGGISDWWTKLMADPSYQSKIAARWQQLRQGPLSDARMTATINSLSTPLAGAAQRNFQRWPNLGTAQVGGFGTQVTQTWDQQIQILRTYVTQRAGWLDSSGWRPAAATTTRGVGGF